jgi:hypothetical protein
MTQRKGVVLWVSGLVVLWPLITVVHAVQEQNWFQPRVTRAQVTGEIARALPRGTTVPRVVAFLGSRGWLNPREVETYTVRSVIDSLGGSKFEKQHPDSTALFTSIPNAYPGLVVSGSIDMTFYFDGKGHLMHYELRDAYSGP